jgi:gliding motility-associated-like protein
MKKYIIAVVFSCVVAFLQAQKIPAPDLQCIVNDAVSANITLSWTNQGNPCGGTFNGYKIFASTTKGGPYSLKATVTTESQTSYVDVGALGISQTWFYYMEADYTCPGLSTAQSDTVDNSPPVIPAIVNVDVQPDGHVQFTWEVSPSPQTHKYIVYYYLNNNGNATGIPLDSTTGRNTNTYLDTKGDPTTQSLLYTVAAKDSCNKISAFNDNAHRTIFLEFKTSSCERNITLSWTKYINWPKGVKEYRVIVSKNLGPYEVVGVVDSATQTFSYTGFNDKDTLCITVAAVSAADTNIISHSNYRCMLPLIVQAPTFVDIINATVNLDNTISVTWLVDSTSELLYHQVDNSINGNVYSMASQYKVTLPLTEVQNFTDSFSAPQLNSVYYKITEIDSCSAKYSSAPVRTINLIGELSDYYQTALSWNNFELDSIEVLYYNLYRDYGPGYQLIRTFQPGTNDFNDSLQVFLAEKGKFCYRIEAVYGIKVNGFSDTLSSFSNVLCIDHRPIIYIPNAFAPYGVNSIFKPTIIFGDPSNYSMLIFNRWGAKIFESNAPAVGWDGTQGGKDVQQGAYAYLIRFTASDGTSVERKGMVMLVK